VGVKTLEEKGFRGAVMDCVKASYEKSVELGKK
jgi:pyrroline-5-carboxylate reductase